MSTRADFYIGMGKDATWLGSVGMDGDPKSIAEELSFTAQTTIADEDDWVESVAVVFRDHIEHTLPERGWPWPWDDSQTTDYAYTLFYGQVWVSNYGCRWMHLEDYLSKSPTIVQMLDNLPDATEVFPDMSKIKNVRLDSGNAPMIFGFDGAGHVGLVNEEST